MKNEIIILNESREIEANQIFHAENMQLLLAEIENQARSIVLDVTTENGRKEIASWAFKIAKTKTALDNAGKSLTEDWQRQTKAVNLVRKQAWDFLENLQKEVRKPLDDFEAIQEARLKEKTDRLNEIEFIKNSTPSSQNPTESIIFYEKSLEKVNELLNFDWSEFSFKAEKLAEEVILILQLKIADAKQHEHEQLELTRLRKEKEERDKKDHEEKIAREAAEKAKFVAEMEAAKKAKAIREAAEAEQRRLENEKLKAEQEKIAAEEAKINAEKRAIEAERLAKEQAQQAEERRVAAEIKAKEEAEKAAQEAIEKERLRVEEEKRRQQEEITKREADKIHRSKINHEIHVALKKALTAGFCTETLESDQAIDDIIEAIAKGEVPHVQINY